MKEIRVGIIGFGFMGKAHTYGYKTIPLYYDNLPFKIKLAGVCNRTLETAVKAKEVLDFEFATADPDEILERDDIDVVNICTPNIFHKEALLKAIQKGKHIYCDKPLATNYIDAQEILQAFAGRKDELTVQMALQYRFYPPMLRAKELIEEGRIGNVLSFRVCYLHSGSVDPKRPIGWKQDQNIGGGGVLFDLGSHVLDLVYYLLGEYRAVLAENTVVYRERPDKSGKMIAISAEDLSLMLVKMINGGTGSIEVSKVATGANDELRFEIHGDKGAVRFNLMDPNWLDFYDNTLPDVPLGGTKGYTRIECVQRYPKPGGSFPSSKMSIGWIRGHVHSLYNFLQCVYERKPASPSLEEAVYIQYVMEKAYESHSQKAWVQL